MKATRLRDVSSKAVGIEVYKSNKRLNGVIVQKTDKEKLLNEQAKFTFDLVIRLMQICLVAMCSLLIMWILVSWCDIMFNNITTGKVATWNAFKVLVDNAPL